LKLPIGAVKTHHHLKHSATSVGQTQGLGGMAVMGIGLVADWDSCRADAGEEIDAWFLDVLVVVEPERGMHLVMVGSIEGFALAVALRLLRLALK
jgi:hypothetical protein